MRQFFSRKRLWFLFALLVPLGFLIGVARKRPQTIGGVGSAPIALTFSSDNRPIMMTEKGDLVIAQPSQNRWRLFPTNHSYPTVRSGANERLFTLWPSIHKADSPYIGVWNTQTQKLLSIITVPPETIAFSLSKDEKLLAIGAPTRAVIFDLSAMPKIAPQRGNNASIQIFPTRQRINFKFIISALDLSPDGSKLVVVNSALVFDNVRIYNVSDAKLSASSGHESFRFGASGVVRWAPDGQVFAVAGKRDLLIFDANAKLLAQSQASSAPTFGGSTQVSLSFSPDGQKLAWGADEMQIWSIAEKREIKNLPVPGPCAFSNDGKLLTRKINDTNLWLWPQ